MRKLFIFITAICLLLVSCAPDPAPVGWSRIRPKTSPPPRSQGAVAYNTKARQAVMFGGIASGVLLDDTWTWDGNNWRKPRVNEHPSAREMSAMAYDPARNRVVLFGGLKGQISFSDTWEWNGSRWMVMSPAHHPQNRCCHAMAYDAVHKRVLLYGGWSSAQNEFFFDTWAWDGTDWTDVTWEEAPPASGHAMVDFPAGNEIVALNSVDEYGTWVWDGARWLGLSMAGPPARQDGKLVYYPPNRLAVLFGGSRAGEILDDTWVFNGSAWLSVELEKQPPARYGHIMFYDLKRKALIMFGGINSEGPLNDTWGLTFPADF